MADLPQNDQYNTGGPSLGHLGSYSALKGIPLSRPSPTSYPNVQASAQASVPVGQTFDSSKQPASQPLTPDIKESNFKGGGTPGGYNWQMPTSAENVQVRSFPPNIDTGQYMTDTSDPGNNLKISRGLTPYEKSIILQGKSPQMYQVDHIIPLSAGGADTNANLHVLSNTDHGKKTQIEAVPFTLLTNGKITRDQARLMAMKWKDLDTTDFPHVYTDTESDGFPGTMSVEDAQNVADRWATQGKTVKPVTFKDMLAGIPEGMKNLRDLFGKNSLPNEVAEPLKGFATGVTAGWVPYQPSEDAGIASKVLGYGGYLGGSIATMGGIMGLFGKAAGMAPTAVKAVTAGSRATAAKIGFKVAQTAEEVAPEVSSGVSPFSQTVAQMGSKVAKPSFYNTIDKRAFAKFTAAGITYGQLSPEGIVGAIAGREDATPVKRLVEDTLYSAVTGITPPGMNNSLKLFSGILLGNTLANSIAGRETTADDFINAATMAAFHAVGSKSTQARIDGLAKSFDEDFSQRVSHDIFHAYDTTGAYPKVGEMDPLPVKTSAEIDQAVLQAQRSVNRRFLGLDQETIPFIKGSSKIIPGEKIQGKDWVSTKPTELPTYKASTDGPNLITGDMDAYNAEMQRIQTAALILKRGGLTPGDLLEHDKALIQSYVDKLHKQKPEANRPITHPSDVSDVSFHITNSPEWQNSYPEGVPGEPATAPYVGRMALTGHSVNTKGGVQGNLPPVLDYFDILDKTYARPGTAGKEATRKVFGINVTEQKAAYDQFGPKGENTVIWFTPVKDTKTGTVTYLKLGYSPTNERLNLNPDAINNTKAVKDGYYEPIPSHMNKDQVAELMRKDGIRVLFGSVSPRSEVSTKKSGNPWLEINVTNDSRQASLDYAKKQQMTPAQQGVANTAHGLQMKLLTAGVSKVSRAITKPTNVVFSSFRDVAKANNPQAIKSILRDKIGIDVTDKEALAIFNKIQKDPASFGEEIETTKSILDGFYDVFSSNTPQKLKDKLQGIFNVTIDEEKAQELFLRQDAVSIKEAVGLLGNNAEFLPDFLKGPLLKRGDKHSGELPFINRSIIGGMKEVQRVEPTPNPFMPPKVESTMTSAPEAPTSPVEAPNLTQPQPMSETQPVGQNEVQNRAPRLDALDTAVAGARETNPNYAMNPIAPSYNSPSLTSKSPRAKMISEAAKEFSPQQEQAPALIRQNINEPTELEKLRSQQDAPQEIMAQANEESSKTVQDSRKEFVNNIINETVDIGKQKLDEVEFSKRTGDEGYNTLLRNVVNSTSPRIKGKQFAPGVSSTGQPLTQDEKRFIDDEVRRQLNVAAEGVYNTKIDAAGTLGFTVGLKKGDDMFEEAKMVIEAENAAKFGNHTALADLKESMGDDVFQAVQALVHPEWGTPQEGRMMTKQEIDWNLWEKTQRKVAQDIINQFIDTPKSMPEGTYMRTVSDYLDEFFPSVFGKDWKDNRLVNELLASLSFKEGQGKAKFSFFGSLLNTKSETKTQPIEYLREMSSGTRKRAQEILKQRRAEVNKAREEKLAKSPEAKSGIPSGMLGHIETAAQQGDLNVETPTPLDEIFAGLTVAVHDGTTPTAQNAINDMMRFSHEFTTAYQNLYSKKLNGKAFSSRKLNKQAPTELTMAKNPPSGNLLPDIGGTNKKNVKWEVIPKIKFSGNDAGKIAEKLITNLSGKGVVMGNDIAKGFPEYWDKVLQKHKINLSEQKDFGVKAGTYFKKTLLPQFSSLTKLGIVPKNKNNSPIEKITKYGKTLFAREKSGANLSKEEGGFLSHYLKWQNLNQGFSEAKRATSIGASDYPKLREQLKKKDNIGGYAKIGALVGGAGALTAAGIVGTKALLSTYGMSTDWSDNLSKEVKDSFPFDDLAITSLRSVSTRQKKITDKQNGNDVEGGYKIAGKNIFDIARHVFPDKIAEKIADWKISQLSDPANVTIKKDLEQPVKIIMAHEMLHHLYNQKIDNTEEDFGKNWFDAWNNISGKYPQLKRIDQQIADSYDTSDWTNVANERYSFLGQNAMENGINGIPPELQQFYSGVIKGANKKEPINKREVKPDGQGGLMDSITAPFKPLEYTAPSKVTPPPSDFADPTQKPAPLIPPAPQRIQPKTQTASAISATTPTMVPPERKSPFSSWKFSEPLEYVAPLVKKAQDIMGPSLNAVKTEGEKIYSDLKGPKQYKIRGLNVNDRDLNEAANILFTEISNRPGKTDFEVKNALNVALNRVQDSGGKKTLTQILQAPNQFQGYAPEGFINKKGKKQESQYQKLMSGKIGGADKKKLQMIKDIMAEVAKNGMDDTTGGARFYVHASDQTMWLGKSVEEAKKNALNHEKSVGAKRSQFGTMVGMPIARK